MDKRWLRCFATRGALACIFAGLLGAHGVAIAHDPDIVTAVEPLPASATLTTPALATFASYQVTLTHNDENEVLRPVYFTASTAVLDASGAEVSGQSAAFAASSLPNGCTAPTPTSISCTFSGGLTAPGQSMVFTLTVNTPTAGAQIRLASRTSWVEHYEVEATPTQCAFTQLAAPDPNVVSTYVPSSAAPTMLFTGVNGGAATPTDTWTTTVTLPPASQATTASVAETVSPVTCAANLLTCSTSDLAIPGTFANLTIILRRDATTIAKHAKIASAKIFYDNPSHPDPRVVYPLQLLPCSDTTYGPLPQAGIPCISSRTDYPNRSSRKHPVPAGFEGDWEFTILARDNGRFTN